MPVPRNLVGGPALVESRVGGSRALAQPDDRPPVAACPACGLTGIPVVDGKLAVHQWHRGRWKDLDTDDNPGITIGESEPGRWIGGCENRDPGPLPPSGG